MSVGGIHVVDEVLMDEIRSLGNTVAEAEEGLNAFRKYMREGLSSLTFDIEQLRMFAEDYKQLNDFIHAKHSEMVESVQKEK